MNKLILAVMVSTLYWTSPLALASFDDMSCRWSDYCALGGAPYLDAENDTRINLLMLTAYAHELPLGLSAIPSDIRRSRAYSFGLFKGTEQPMPVIGAPKPTTPPVLTPQMAALDAQALKLGIKPSGLNSISEKSESEGRWVSNNLASLSQFFQALLADPQLSDAERNLLALRRTKIYRGEEQTEQFSPAKALYATGSHAAAFRDYLIYAQSFYLGQFSDADAGFLSLKESDQKWIAETATYMLFRVALNQMTENATDQYGMFAPAKVNKDAGASALQRAENYLTTYPGGNYVDSVRGLLRRVNWYLSDWPHLAQLYENGISAATNIDVLSNLVDEADKILLSRDIPYHSEEQPFISTDNTPLLTFTQTMKWLRENNRKSDSTPKVSAEMLQSYKPMFVAANQLPLWEYMRNAWLFYQQQDYATLVATIQPASKLPTNDPIAFSQQILYGKALAQSGKWAQAESHWRHLLGLELNPHQQQYVQLMLTTTLVHENKVSDIFLPESPVTNLRYRSLVLKSLANKTLLQQQATAAPTDEEKNIALYILLFNELMVGDYQGFIEDKSLKKAIKPLADAEKFADVDLGIFNWDGKNTEAGYFCPSLDETVAVLAKNKTDPHAMNCLAEFFRTNPARVYIEAEIDGNEELVQLAFKELKRDNAQGRLKFYQWVINDATAEPEDKTYALYRAVMCFAPSGYNDCDRQEIAPQTRQRWFNLLKTQYKGNQWEQKLKYYW
ncbi:hypothetical protein C9426_29330 [Serratia sp. S1B]|nr:hypothetical protein C9426_29330 [Serratia sp. S1B]